MTDLPVKRIPPTQSCHGSSELPSSPGLPSRFVGSGCMNGRECCNATATHACRSPWLQHGALKVQQGMPSLQNACAGRVIGSIPCEYLLYSASLGDIRKGCCRWPYRLTCRYKFKSEVYLHFKWPNFFTKKKPILSPTLYDRVVWKCKLAVHFLCIRYSCALNLLYIGNWRSPKALCLWLLVSGDYAVLITVCISGEKTLPWDMQCKDPFCGSVLSPPLLLFAEYSPPTNN